MKCQHGNEITVLIELYADSYESFTVSRYNSEGKAYRPGTGDQEKSFDRLRVRGCPECKTIKFEEE